MAVQDVVILSNGKTHGLFQLGTRGPGIYEQRMSIYGNSLLSSVFLQSADPGAEVLVEYFESTTGDNLPATAIPEDVPLNSHPLLLAADSPMTSKILVTRIHDKPRVKITVTGGNATFGVYISVRSETASDVDNALNLDGTDAELLVDKGIVSMCYDESTGKLNFIRCEDGAIKITGEVNITATEITDREYGSDSLTYGSSSTLITYSPLVGEKSRIHSILVTGDGSGDFSININGLPWGTLRTSWNDRQVIFPLNGKLIDENDTITIEAENTTPAQSGICAYEAYLYRGPE